MTLFSEKYHKTNIIECYNIPQIEKKSGIGTKQDGVYYETL